MAHSRTPPLLCNEIVYFRVDSYRRLVHGLSSFIRGRIGGGTPGSKSNTLSTKPPCHLNHLCATNVTYIHPVSMIVPGIAQAV